MQKKTLSQLKKDIEIGTSILCIGIKEADYLGNQEGEGSIFKYSKELHDVPLNDKMKKTRLIISKNTTGFYLKDINDDTQPRGSLCGYPQATALSYIGDIFTITEKTQDGEIWQTRTYQIIN